MLRPLAASAALAAAARLRAGGVVINEHTLSAEQTRAHVDALGRWFDFIHPSDVPARLARPGRRPFCLLTFDDGHRSNAVAVAPELSRLGVPASFLLVTSFVGSREVLWFTLYARLRRKLGTPPPGLSARAVKQLPHELLLERLEAACRRHGVDTAPGDDDTAAMTWDEARALRRAGFDVGAHGETHAVMTRQTREAALANIERSIARVSAELGTPCRTFAFPNGNYTAELAQHAARCGASLVMTAEPTWLDERCRLWRVPRVQLFPEHDRAKIELKVAVAALGRFIESGDGTGLAYRRVNRLARRFGQWNVFEQNAGSGCDVLWSGSSEP